MSAFTHFPTASITKVLLSTAGALVVTFAAFVFMDKLISQEQIRVSTTPEVIDLSFFVNKQDSAPQPMQKLPPPPTLKPQPPKAIERTSVAAIDIGLIFTPTLSLGPINHAPPILSQQDTGATAIVRSEPKYPIAAARDGIEGWVQLNFTISSHGQVINATVVNAEPKRIFNKEALRAITRWKYRPKIVNGQAIAQPNQNVVLEFKLNQ
ncbi:energy transducer TonB [Pseudoalteromonas sp. MMG013]|uniref:energy transducer TonB n=1 Tax=Pseudoalteromonas sp. MMG013 TaxID=2822687 RepID=UPI001B3722E2|nr:energy transducer TonB [Pseudoalteromonas sp. MMG013]MBQ4861120.1 energy transducer TonB [Pseudoalteromonas sp. MMG013]